MPKVKSKRPVWRGPEVDGVTQSMLSRFLVCRERFRLLVVEGLRPVDGFNHKLEYGQMWHVCEEYLAEIDARNATAAQSKGGWDPVSVPDWGDVLKPYCRTLCKKYPTQQEQVNHWYEVCKVQFPLYVEYWAKHPDVTSRTPLLQEQVFDVPYRLPSGRTVRLRGKWDSVDLIGNGKSAGVYLQENKTKGDIDEQQIKKQLSFDLQTMFYLVALQEYDLAAIIEPMGLPRPRTLSGVRYNVIRRPLSGGAGSIRQHKPSKSNPRGESTEEFYARLGGLIKEAPETYFMRWKVEVTPADVERFRRECLDPILEDLLNWWFWIEEGQDPFVGDGGAFYNAGMHYRTPFGLWNVLAEGGSHELDEYLATGSELGLQRTDNLFPELTDA
jgi:hypothetical protein